MRARLLLSAIILLIASQAQSAQTRELYRIRIFNSIAGPIEVSADAGKTYTKVGKVTLPATISTEGYTASVYAIPGTVAATAVHGIRIKTAGERECSVEASQVISIVPAEFAVMAPDFGGYFSGSSMICTDIPTGKAIFRNLAPLVGNKVFRQMGDDLVPVKDGYVPDDGDILVVVVTIPGRYPDEITFQNREGGRVEAVYPNGTELIAKVQRPVRGVGRFDATGYTGVGRINTNHTGVLTISTAAISTGGKGESRGGFMIQPSRHGKHALETAQVMIVGPPGAGWLEGNPPLFSGYIGLFYDPADDTKSFLVDARKKGSDWMPLPAIVGVHNDALSSITDIRIRFPKLTSEWVRSQLTKSGDEYYQTCRARAVKNGTVVSGMLNLEMSSRGLSGVKSVNLYVDGRFRGAITDPPYSFSLDTNATPKGEHSAELRAVNSAGGELGRMIRIFFVQ